MIRDPTFAGFVAGAISVGFVAVSLFFLKFWRRTGDDLFLAFSAAFVLLALGQTITALAEVPSENLSGVYLIRLAAFMLIICAVLTKNLRGR